MLEPVKRPDARASWKSLWRSEIVAGILFLVIAADSRDYFFALMAVGVIVAGIADYVDRRGGRLWWTLVGTGIILALGGLYLDVHTGQLWDLFHNIFNW